MLFPCAHKIINSRPTSSRGPHGETMREGMQGYAGIAGRIAFCVATCFFLFCDPPGATKPDDCASGQTKCGTACVDLSASDDNCNACGAACGSGSSCVAGQCTQKCEGSKKQCSGACVDLDADDANCGTCGNTHCTDQRNDRNNCGACGKVCPGTQVCVAAQCVPAGACGPTNEVCSSNHVTPVCTGNVCAGACAMGYGDCNHNKQTDGCETSLGSNPNCGVCGHTCAVGESCLSGQCLPNGVGEN